MHKFKIGDEAWFFDAYDNLVHGFVREFRTVTKKGKTVSYAALDEINENGSFAGQRSTPLFTLHHTKEACLNAAHEESERRRAVFKQQIEDLPALIAFVMSHNISGEFRDCDARRAVRERAFELLGEDAFTPEQAEQMKY